MNMMDRFVEGRGHRREIDMLLELSYVPPRPTIFVPIANKMHRKQIEGRTILRKARSLSTSGTTKRIVAGRERLRCVLDSRVVGVPCHGPRCVWCLEDLVSNVG